MDQNEFTIKFKKWDIVNSAIQTSLKVGGFVAIVGILASAFKVFAGKQTLLNVAMEIVAHLNLSVKISYALALSGVAYGLRQRTLRRKVIAKMSEHQRKLEEFIDERRTSSELTLKGTTRPDDKALG